MGNTARFPLPLLPYDKQAFAYDRELMIDTSSYKLFIKLDGKNIDLFDEISKAIYDDTGNDRIISVSHGGTGLNVIPKNNIIYSNEANSFAVTPISEFGRTLINSTADEEISGLNACTLNGYKVDNTSTTDGLWIAEKIIEYVRSNTVGVYAIKGSLSCSKDDDDVSRIYHDVPHSNYKNGWTYRVIEKGTYAGNKCNVGDIVYALKDFDGTYSDTDWGISQGNLDDDAIVTSVSLTGGTKNHVPIFYDNAGNKLQDSGKELPDGDIVGTLSFANAVNAGVIKVKETTTTNYIELDKDNFAKIASIDPSTFSSAVPVEKGGTGATSAEDALKNLGLLATAEQINTLPNGLSVQYGGTGLTSIDKNTMLFASENNVFSPVITTSFGRDLLNASLGKVIVGLDADTVDGYHVDDTTIDGLWSASKVSKELENLKIYVGNKKSDITSAITDFNQPTASDADWDTIISNLNNISKDATASEEMVLEGYTFYANGTKCTGSIVYQKFENNCSPVAASGVAHMYDSNVYHESNGNNLFILAPKGYYDGDTWIGWSDPYIIPENIKAGISFGSQSLYGKITGTFTDDATITENDVLDGKIGYSHGNKVTGNLIARFLPTDDGLYIGPVTTEYPNQPLIRCFEGYGIQYRSTLQANNSCGWGPNNNLAGLIIAPPIGYYSNHINGDNTDDRPTSYVYISDQLLASVLGITQDKITTGNTICGIDGNG